MSTTFHRNKWIWPCFRWWCNKAFCNFNRWWTWHWQINTSSAKCCKLCSLCKRTHIICKRRRICRTNKRPRWPFGLKCKKYRNSVFNEAWRCSFSSWFIKSCICYSRLHPDGLFCRSRPYSRNNKSAEILCKWIDFLGKRKGQRAYNDGTHYERGGYCRSKISGAHGWYRNFIWENKQWNAVFAGTKKQVRLCRWTGDFCNVWKRAWNCRRPGFYFHHTTRWKPACRNCNCCNFWRQPCLSGRNSGFDGTCKSFNFQGLQW